MSIIDNLFDIPVKLALHPMAPRVKGILGPMIPEIKSIISDFKDRKIEEAYARRFPPEKTIDQANSTKNNQQQIDFNNPLQQVTTTVMRR